MVTVFNPSWFASCFFFFFFCREASGAGPGYVTKSRYQYQMGLLGPFRNQIEKYCMQHLSHPTATFPNPCTLLLSWSSAQSSQSLPSPQRQAIGCIQLWLWCPTVCIGRELELQAFDLLMLHPLECSWVIVFHKRQNVDLTVRAKCKLEKLHLDFLWLTQASRWKWFPKVTAKLSATVPLVWRTYGAGQDFFSCSHPWLWQSEPAPENFSPIMGDSQEQHVPVLSPVHFSLHPPQALLLCSRRSEGN